MGVGTSLRICEKWAMNQTESEARFDYTVLSLEYCTLRSIYKPWERFHSIIWASCPLLIYILFIQILGFCFLNVILLLYSFFKIYLSFLNFNFKQKQEFFFSKILSLSGRTMIWSEMLWLKTPSRLPQAVALSLAAHLLKCSILSIREDSTT